ncbi:hypothetical protein [Undibacterium sp. Ji22W]|uniref:hypothetical protein n=1 Tax=Undibacterium sp. Ji22W TaxID=3413038 RepID=UPI003BEF8198
MSVAYYIVPEREIEGFDHFVNGKALGHADEDTLNHLCEELSVQSILSFISQDPEELADFMEDEGIEMPAELPETRWFDATVGLATVRALAVHLENNPDALKDASNLVEDLREYENVLERFEQEKVRWYLGLDF